MTKLPDGFVLDEEPIVAALPFGFVLDEESADLASSQPTGEQSSTKDRKSNHADAVSFPWGTGDEATDTISFGLAKKLGAGAIGLIDATASAAAGGEFNPGERYNNQLEEYQAAQRLFGMEHPNRRLAGQGVGLGVSIARMPAVALTKGTGLGWKLLNVSATGGLYGGISGAAQDADGLQERAENTLGGGLLGAGVAPASIPIAKGIGGIIGAVKERVVNPTVEALKKFSQQGYKQAEEAGLVFSPEAYGRVVEDISAEAAKRGIGKGDFADITSLENPTISNLIQRMEKLKTAPTGPKFTDVEIMRRVAAESQDPAASMVASKLRGMIDKAGKEDFLTGNVDDGLAGISQGRDNWARMERAKVVDQALRQAKNSKSEYSEALRQKFQRIADSDEFLFWPPQEQEFCASSGPRTPRKF